MRVAMKGSAAGAGAQRPATATAPGRTAPSACPPHPRDRELDQAYPAW